MQTRGLGAGKSLGFSRAAKPRDIAFSLALMLPSLAGTAVFVVVPFLGTLKRSFRDAMDGVWVGVANYASVVNNQAFHLASVNTLRFIAICLPLLLSLSLILAVLCRSSGRRSGFFGATFLMPMAVPVASVALVWRAVFANHGMLSGVLVSMGLPGADFINGEMAFGVLIFSYLWRNAGYDMVLWQAGLSGIDESVYEAARVDGAGAFRCFFSITLPLLAPTFYAVTVLSLLNAFKAFREAYLVAGNYPNDSIYLLQHLFGNWFTKMEVQKLSAAAVMLCLALMVPIALMSRVWEGD